MAPLTILNMEMESTPNSVDPVPIQGSRRSQKHHPCLILTFLPEVHQPILRNQISLDA
jgi:hypothetical protein